MITKLLQNIFRGLGYEVSSIKKKKKNLRWLTEMNFKTILDIGANEGQFAGYIMGLFPKAKVYSFEPLPETYKKLTQNLGHAANFKSFNCAVGNDDSEIEIHVNEYTPASSILPMADLHKESFPYSSNEGKIAKVKLVKIDTLEKELRLEKPMLVKIDVQGFEREVLRGGNKVIGNADVVIVEMCIESLYENQPLFAEIYDELRAMGFKYHGNYDQLLNREDGRVLVVDGIFKK